MDRREYVSAHLDVSPGTEKRLETPSSDTPFRIVLLGDFSGRGNRGIAAESRLRGRRAIAIDLDNYEEVLARLRAQLELPGPDEPIRLQFESLDDFHPEALNESVPLFRELRAQQDALLESPTRPRRPAPVRPSDPVPEMLSSGSLLDDILSGAESPAPSRERPRDVFAQHLHEIVSPHLQAAPSAQQEALAAQVEDTIGLAMRMVLHHPEFQDLEAAWRSVDFLLRRLELSSDLQLHLIDLSKQELLDDVSKADDLKDTGLYRLLVEEAGGTAGELPWALIAGLYTFEAQPAEIRALGAIGRVAREAGAPFVCSVSPRFMGTEGFTAEADSDDWQAPLASEAEQEWAALRTVPEASWIGASLPRFILRDPYTKASVDAFPFEEMTTPPEHSDYLWGNPAVAVACLVGESFSQDGWDVQLRNTKIGTLPVHTWKQDGDLRTTPCAECWMTERTADRFLSRGIMPLASIKHSDSVRLIRLQSIANPAARLRARWS